LQIKNALISVSDKKGIAEFAKGLSSLGIEIMSTGGTAAVISQAGIKVQDVAEYTGYPEMLDGRVKTLHPRVEGGILAKRKDKSHQQQMADHGIKPIDLVCVNLYPFERTIADPDCTLEDAIENIDVGGPTLLRAAAKNHESVAAITDPADYDPVLSELSKGKRSLPKEMLRKLAVKAFAHTASYDAAIQSYLSKRLMGHEHPDTLSLSYEKAYDLRYGENSHQSAAFYTQATDECSISNAKIVTEGKKLSFNNILDADAALELVKEFPRPAAVIVKHLNPSGVGTAQTISDAYDLAHKADPMSAFGCIVALNREPDERLAQAIASTFVEAVIAPSFPPEALKIMSVKKNMRLLAVGETKPTSDAEFDTRKVVGGLLCQKRDLRRLTDDDMTIVTKRKPTEEEMSAMIFAWKVCRHTKSNSIIFAKPGYTVGIGAGQMSRVDSVKIAVMKAASHSVGAVMASDAFFPFRDGIDEAAKAGVTAVIHPGGSIRDEQVIEAANEHGMAMVFTGIRCFLH